MKLQAYDPKWAFQTALRERAARWQRQQLLSATQLAAIEAAYPLSYYRPEWPLRVGLFLFALLGLAMASGFTFLITADVPFLAGLLHCAACFGVLELLIRERRFYHAGADNALLYAGLSGAVGLIFSLFSQHIWFVGNSLTPGSGSSYLMLLLIVALLVAAAIRYADALVVAAAFITALILIALLSMSSTLGQALLPFIMMATAAGTLVLVRLLNQRLAGTYLADYYASGLLMLKVLSLSVFYLGGNYLVVREGNAELNHLYQSTQIPFAPVFYALTAGIPLLYITLGLRRADRPMLLLGLLALAFSVFTVRYYHSLLPPEIAAVIAGALFTVLAGALLRWLRPARFGLTSEADDEPRYFNLENLIQAQTAHAPAAPAGNSFEFGGGQSGGGGATGQF